MLVEGAGSAAEINLRAGDIANMGFARAADVPVVLVGDIDRGGVIASLVGTKAVLDPADAAMIVGFLVNKFRGDPALFADGMTAHRASAPAGAALGLVPYLRRRRIACRPRMRVDPAGPNAARADGRVRDRRAGPIRASPISTISTRCGSTRASSWSSSGPAPAAAGRRRPGHPARLEGDDRRLASLREPAGTSTSRRIVRRGGPVLGICGGYQMLGRSDRRSGRHRGASRRRSTGLGLLDVDTVLDGDKMLAEVSGETARRRVPFKGYEMHVGRNDRARSRAAHAAPTAADGA